jgi:hypothetical protein
MHNLIDLFDYKTKKVFSTAEEITKNKLITYDISYDLKLKHFQNFYSQRVRSAIIKADPRVLTDIRYTLGLSRRTKNSDIATKLIDYLSVNTIRQIFALTQFKNDNDLKNFLMYDNIKVSTLVVDLVRAINCNYRIRPLMDSNSALFCNKIIIKNDLDPKEFINLEHLVFDLININAIVEKLELFKFVEITNYEELYHSNDFDFSFYCNISSDNQNYSIVLGEGCGDEHTIAALLLCNKVTNSDNLKQKSDIFSLTHNDILALLKTGETDVSTYSNTNEVKQEFTIAIIESKYTTFNNKTAKVAPIYSNTSNRNIGDAIMANDKVDDLINKDEGTDKWV